MFPRPRDVRAPAVAGDFNACFRAFMGGELPMGRRIRGQARILRRFVKISPTKIRTYRVEVKYMCGKEH